MKIVRRFPTHLFALNPPPLSGPLSFHPPVFQNFGLEMEPTFLIARNHCCHKVLLIIFLISKSHVKVLETTFLIGRNHNWTVKVL